MSVTCEKSKWLDGRHDWRWDGDDPYFICAFCGQRRDALTGRSIPQLRRRPARPAGAGSVTRIGREFSPATEEWQPLSEDIRWIGKPWRRVELLTRRYFWKGEQTGVERDLTLHLGSRRLGLSLTLIVSRNDYDYSEERP